MFHPVRIAVNSTNGTNSTEKVTYVLDSDVKILSAQTRITFYWILLLICIFTIVGNLCAIISIIQRKCKFLQKTCIVSLALSDIFTATIYTVNNLDTFAHEFYVWNLGEFLCHFIPMAQIGGTIASSVALLIIALDRYQNVIYALSKRWNPSAMLCLFSAASLWMLCGVLSYPLYEYYNYYPIKIVILQSNGTLIDSHLCVSTAKGSLAVYYCTLCVVIFCPLFGIFLWFYYHIAVLIWRHRKPVQYNFMKKRRPAPDPDSATKTTEVSSKLETPPTKPKICKVKSVQVERKIRTFKIVITLMLTFILCRLPYIMLNLIKLVSPFENDGAHNQPIWNANFSLLVLNVLNCALNPLLYTFLNETIQFGRIIYDLMFKVFCCFYMPSEFEDFGKNNPFQVAFPPEEKQVDKGGRFRSLLGRKSCSNTESEPNKY